MSSFPPRAHSFESDRDLDGLQAALTARGGITWRGGDSKDWGEYWVGRLRDGSSKIDLGVVAPVPRHAFPAFMRATRPGRRAAAATFVIAVVAAACAKMSETSPPPTNPARQASAGGAPSLDHGDGGQATPFAPGRFANAVQKTTNAGHAMNQISGDETSSFVLNLDPDGSATVCRGWSYLYFNDGPEVHTSERVREQLGYRGRWTRRGDGVDVDVRRVDDVCARVAQYSHLIPRHAAAWHLRCQLAAPGPHSALAAPALVCRSPNPYPDFGEDEPHVVDGVLPGPWLILGRGDGLRIRVDATSVDGSGPPPAVRVEPSRDRIGADAWQTSF